MKEKFKRFFTEKRIILIIRWWVAGAVYFFIGWGTNLGANTNIIDFVFVLSVSLGLVNSFLLNPIIAKMFNTPMSKKYLEMTLVEKLSRRFKDIAQSVIIVIIMIYVYVLINVALISIFKLPNTSVPFPGEPITFGIIYILLYMFTERSKKFIIEEILRKDS